MRQQRKCQRAVAEMKTCSAVEAENTLSVDHFFFWGGGNQGAKNTHAVDPSFILISWLCMTKSFLASMSWRSVAQDTQNLAKVANAYACAAEASCSQMPRVYAGHAWPFSRRKAAPAAPEVPEVTSLADALAPITAFVSADGDLRMATCIMEKVSLHMTPENTNATVLQHIYKFSHALMRFMRLGVKIGWFKNPDMETGKAAQALRTEIAEIAKKYSVAIQKVMAGIHQGINEHARNMYSYDFDRARGRRAVDYLKVFTMSETTPPS